MTLQKPLLDAYSTQELGAADPKPKFAPVLAFCAALASFVFGYHLGVCNTMLSNIHTEFNWSDSAASWNDGLVTSAASVTAAIGAFSAGIVVKALGRRGCMLLVDVFYILGAIILFFANGLGMLIAGRLIVGVGMGLASMAAPMYIAEVSPASLRGILGTLHQLMITVGILVSSLMGLALPGADVATTWWRYMFGASILPALLHAGLFGLVFRFDTPLFLVQGGQDLQARDLLIRLVGPRAAPAELESLQKQVRGNSTSVAEKSSFMDVFRPQFRFIVAIGICLSMAQQASGINSVIFFSTVIFKNAGIEQSTLMTIVVGIVNVSMTVVAAAVMDRAGRRALLLLGCAGCSVSLALLSLAVSGAAGLSSWVAVVGVLFYILFFAISLGPVVWILISEIYPSRIRGPAMSMATGVNWLFTILVGLLFRVVQHYVRDSTIFAVFSAICFGSLAFVWLCVPETKGKSMEELEAMLTNRGGKAEEKERLVAV